MSSFSFRQVTHTATNSRPARDRVTIGVDGLVKGERRNSLLPCRLISRLKDGDLDVIDELTGKGREGQGPHAMVEESLPRPGFQHRVLGC